MKINKKITSFSNFNPTNKTRQEDIATMCDSIEKGRISLPLYQRDLSWTLKKAVDLFEFQLFGKAPVSPLSMNEIIDTESNLVEQLSFLNRRHIEKSDIRSGHLSVIDGQQRLSTNYQAYTDCQSLRNVVLDFSKGCFRLIQGVMKKHQIPVGKLLNKNQEVLVEYLKQAGSFEILFSDALQVRSKLRTYKYTLNIAEDMSEPEQIEWFEILNNAGSRISDLQLEISSFKLRGIDIYKDYTLPFRNKTIEYGFEELFNPFTTNVSYPISALNAAYEVIFKNKKHSKNYAPMPSDTKPNVLKKLNAAQFYQIIDLTLRSLGYTLDFIKSNNLENEITRMDYVLYLSGYFSFNDLNTDERIKEKLRDWVECTNFTNKSNNERREIFENLLVLS